MHNCEATDTCEVKVPDDARFCEKHRLMLKPHKPGDLWLGTEKWGVRGDGITEPFSVYSLDATRTPFGFLPFGFALPGMMEQQAHALCNLLNQLASDKSQLG